MFPVVFFLATILNFPSFDYNSWMQITELVVEIDADAAATEEGREEVAVAAFVVVDDGDVGVVLPLFFFA